MFLFILNFRRGKADGEKKCSSKKISMNRRDLAVVQSHLSGGKDICRPHVALQGQENALESEVLE